MKRYRNVQIDSEIPETRIEEEDDEFYADDQEDAEETVTDTIVSDADESVDYGVEDSDSDSEE